jgi:uncharacterized damage-inducible protein DinB
MSAATFPVLTSAGLLAHWQGHRRVTRRVITAFPEEQINTFSVGGMRSFGELAQELLSMAIPTMKGITTGTWSVSFDRKAQTKAELLADWDAQSKEIDHLWPAVRPEAWQEVMDAFGFFKAPAVDILLYIIDNEIHHRAQGYVYLRALGIEPPQFPDRS